LAARTGVAAISVLTLLAGCAVESGHDDTTSASSALSMVTVTGIGTQLPPIIRRPPADPLFAIHAVGNMCLDAGAAAEWVVGKPITLYWCNGTAAQNFGVHEVANAGHDVNLHVGSFCIGVHGGTPTEGAGLELQSCVPNSVAQEFALDGDSIMSGVSSQPTTEAIFFGGGIVGPQVSYPVKRTYVWKPQSDVTNTKTPMVLGTRQFTLNEDLRFTAVDGSDLPPHSGFVRPTDGPSLVAAINAARYGTVVELADVTYDIPQKTTPAADGSTSLQAPDLMPGGGVTVRGSRRLTENGARVVFSSTSDLPIFTLQHDDIRFTGFRLEGPTDSTDQAPGYGINADEGFQITLDHLEVSKFPFSAIRVLGSEDDSDRLGGTDVAAMCALDDYVGSIVPRSVHTKVARNFIHHNAGAEKGYGVDVNQGAFVWIDGNTEYMNRHSVTQDGQPLTGYDAEDNLVLSNYPTYWDGFQRLWDFDVHGSLPGGTLFEGGIAGDHSEMRYNTFLATGHANVNIRGVPCRQSIIDGNIFPQPLGTSVSGAYVPFAIKTLNVDGVPVPNPMNVYITTNNWFDAPNPTDRIAVADIDGDGLEDLFMATGVGWWYSSGAQSEWRFLRRNSEALDQIRLGDLDGDGRADAVRVGARGASLDVSWGCVSDWRSLTITPSIEPISSYQIGNFDGDRLHGDDIFVTTTSHQWWVASSGRNFAYVGGSGYPMSSLRFGDMDGDGITDVVSISGDGSLAFSSGARQPWNPLGISVPSTNSVFVADLDGDGIADVAKYGSTSTTPPLLTLDVSAHGRSSFVSFPVQGGHAALGRFEGGRKAERIIWEDHQLDLITDLAGTTKRISRQDMR
jgi:hypothetical protein